MKLVPLSTLLRGLLVVSALALPAAALQGPQQLTQLSSFDGRPGDAFGFEVSIDGDRLAVGAPRKRETPPSPVWGAVYVFVRSGTTWVEEAQLKNTDFGAPIDFGIGLALSGDRLAVASSGSAHVFVRQGTSWVEEASWDEEHPGIALWGDTLAIGLVGATPGSPAPASGLVRVHTRQGGSWPEEATLVGSGLPNGSWFGALLSLDANQLLVGAPRDPSVPSGADEPNRGSAYVFTRRGTTWSEEARLTASDAGPQKSFGRNGALSDDTLLIADEDKGLYAFRRGASGWRETQAMPQPWNVISLSVSGRRAAYADSVGASHALRLQGLSWVPDGSWTPPGSGGSYSYGVATELRGPLLFVGDTEFWAGGSGSVYVFDVPTAPTFCDAQDGALASCPCAAGFFDTGCDTAQGTGGVGLTVVTREVVPRNRATVQAFGFPQADAPISVLLRGSVKSSNPFILNDGLHCLGLPLVRMSTAVAQQGSSTHTFGHGPLAGPGTFHYQAWFQNLPVSACNPTEGSSLSSGRSLTW